MINRDKSKLPFGVVIIFLVLVVRENRHYLGLVRAVNIHWSYSSKVSLVARNSM
jgi:hypothetical protein